MNEFEAQPALPLRVGDMLAAGRAKMRLKLDEVAERTRIPLRHLKALETSDHDALPATTYSAGFVKSYAKLLGLDAEALTAEFRAERGERSVMRPQAPSFAPADPSRVPPRLLAGIALATALLFGLGWLAWHGLGGDEARQRLAVGAESAPATAPTPAQPRPAAPAPMAAPSDADKVVLTATGEEVWLKISEAEGKLIYMGTLAPGQSYEVPLEARDPRLQTGRPQSLAATVGARKLDALDVELRTVRGVSLKGARLVAYVESLGAPRSAPGKAADPNSDMATTARP